MLPDHDLDAAAVLHTKAVRAFHSLTIFLALVAWLFVILSERHAAGRQSRSRHEGEDCELFH
jgi:hypothetical protein